MSSSNSLIDALLQHERELREQWQHAHQQVHLAEKAALNLAAADVNRRLEGMNELRTQIDQERGRYLPRELYDREHASLRDALDARLKILENQQANLQGRLWMMGAFLSGVVVIVNLFMRYLGPK